jgi:iron complex transport system substrate-binding protein
MMQCSTNGPQRIVCLTEETTETLYLLGEEKRIVGVSGFSVRPREAREKPRVSAFTSAKIDRILELKPDLVLGFSNLQAAIAQELITAGLNVVVFNQRSVQEILEMILTLSRIVNAALRGIELVSSLEKQLEQIAAHARQFTRHPRVFFEEWMDPLISGIRWVDELVEIAGGTPLFPELRSEHDARRRIVLPDVVAACDPELIIASWCGRKVNKRSIRERQGWGMTQAVQKGHVYEIKSTYILQPGPAALTEGIRQLHFILAHVCGCTPSSELAPSEAMDPDLMHDFGRSRDVRGEPEDQKRRSSTPVVADTSGTARR